MKKLFVSILAIFSIMTFGCSTKYELFQEKSKDDSSKEEKQLKKQVEKPVKFVVEYKIVPGDRISIVVFRHPELSTRKFDAFQRDLGLLVSPQGTVTLPLIGEVKIQGLTRVEAADLIEEKLSKYLKNPHVYIEILNQRVYVLGEVNKPGAVQFFDERISLVEALSRAGDFNIYAKRDRVMVIRGDLANPTIITVDFTDKDELQYARMILQPHDIVYVPPTNLRKSNVVVEQIAPPFRLLSNILQPFVQIKYLSQ
ncbi:MAG: polysaccharide export protein [Aquificae bacterium]|nr:polysaccharide export protein [Aquificota bacterium]